MLPVLRPGLPWRPLLSWMAASCRRPPRPMQSQLWQHGAGTTAEPLLRTACLFGRQAPRFGRCPPCTERWACCDAGGASGWTWPAGFLLTHSPTTCAAAASAANNRSEHDREWLSPTDRGACCAAGGASGWTWPAGSPATRSPTSCCGPARRATPLLLLLTGPGSRTDAAGLTRAEC